MRELTFLEELAERFLEGSFIRALKPKLQPVQLAKALAREMTGSQMVGPEGPLVANRYSIYLSSTDFAQFTGFQTNLERELAAYLRGYAARRRYRPIAAISVEIRESSHLKAGRFRTEGVMMDLAPSAPPATVLHDENRAPRTPSIDHLQGTMEMATISPLSPPRVEALPSPSQPPATLLGDNGETIPILRPTTSIGRSVDNDVVLESKSVSRRHAQIRWDGEHFVLEDLGSTNGTFASRNRIVRHSILDGDELSFGGVRFIFRQSQE